MKTLQRIYSEVQQEIGDLSFSRIERAEYIDICQEIAEQFAMDTRVWMATATITPNPVSAPVSPAPTTALIPANLAPYYIYRLVRGTTESREYTKAAVLPTAAGAYSFVTNAFSIGIHDYATEINPDESMTLYFATGFEPDEQLTIEYLTSRPFTTALWTDSISIPDWLARPFELGIKLRIMKRLFNQGDDTMAARIPLTDSDFTKEQYKAIAYTHKLKDRRSPLQLQSNRYLSE